MSLSFNRTYHLIQVGQGFRVGHHEGLEVALGAGVYALDSVDIGDDVGAGRWMDWSAGIGDRDLLASI